MGISNWYFINISISISISINISIDNQIKMKETAIELEDYKMEKQNLYDDHNTETNKEKNHISNILQS